MIFDFLDPLIQQKFIVLALTPFSYLEAGYAYDLAGMCVGEVIKAQTLKYHITTCQGGEICLRLNDIVELIFDRGHYLGSIGDEPYEHLSLDTLLGINPPFDSTNSLPSSPSDSDTEVLPAGNYPSDMGTLSPITSQPQSVEMLSAGSSPIDMDTLSPITSQPQSVEMLSAGSSPIDMDIVSAVNSPMDISSAGSSPIDMDIVPAGNSPIVLQSPIAPSNSPMCESSTSAIARALFCPQRE